MYKRIISWNGPFPINILDFLTPLPALGEIWWYWRAFVSEFRPNHNHSIDITARGLLAVLIMGYRSWSDKKKKNRNSRSIFRFSLYTCKLIFCFIRNLKNLIWIWVQLPTLPKMTNKFILNWLVTSITFMMIKMLRYWT